MHYKYERPRCIQYFSRLLKYCQDNFESSSKDLKEQREFFLKLFHVGLHIFTVVNVVVLSYVDQRLTRSRLTK